MKLDVITIFPQMVRALVAEGIIGRAIAEGLLNVAVHDLRDYTDDRHRVVDDTPYGGGPGMVLKPEPMFRAVEAIQASRGALDSVIVTSPQGRVFTQAEAARLAGLSHIAIVCGRYEGVDERVSEGSGAEELSIGDYVLSGGELAALVILDAVARLCPAWSAMQRRSKTSRSRAACCIFRRYTRPAVFRERKVPDVLLSGHHGDIRAWRRREALRRTLERRPDLLKNARLDGEERARARRVDSGADEGSRR